MRIKAFFVYVFVCMFFACEQNPRYVLPEKTEKETDAKRPGIETQREETNEVSEKEKTVKSPVIETIAETEKETEKPKEPKVLKPITEYPAYILDQCGALWGIPSSLMGESHKERVKIETVDGIELPMTGIQFFTKQGVAYITHSYTDEDGKQCVDYYAQELGLKTPKIELVDSIPVMPEIDRVSFDSPQWLIESTVISGTEWSYLYNRNGAVWGGAGKGEWICRKEKITGYAVLSAGILIMSSDGGEFCPSNRKSLNTVSEPGRVWQ